MLSQGFLDFILLQDKTSNLEVSGILSSTLATPLFFGEAVVYLVVNVESPKVKGEVASSE